MLLRLFKSYSFVFILCVLMPFHWYSRLQVRPYPRRAFGDGEGASTLDELGLTNKQEALFLELI